MALCLKTKKEILFSSPYFCLGITEKKISLYKVFSKKSYHYCSFVSYPTDSRFKSLLIIEVDCVVLVLMKCLFFCQTHQVLAPVGGVRPGRPTCV